jgi:hypothetical protein
VSAVLADLAVGALSRVLRPTLLVGAVFGAVGVGIACLLGAPLAALGIVIGLALAVLNIRMLAAGVTKVEMDGTEDKAGTKVIKRVLRTRSAVRLVVLTLVTIGALLLSAPLGMGIVIGLVVFQIAFVVNAGRAVLREGIS